MVASKPTRLFTSIRVSAQLPSTVTASTNRTLSTQTHLSRWQKSCPTLQYCPQCSRPCYRSFTTSSQTRYSSKRLLMTESVNAYRPHSLQTPQPPPRNLGVAETSIAGGLNADAQSQSSSWPGRAPPAPTASSDEHALTAERTAMREGEAQKATVVPPSSTTATNDQEPATKPARRLRLRARKAAMTLTPAAVSHLRGLLDQPEPKLIRVGVKNKGCSGSAYHLEYVDKPAKFDEQVEQDGVKVLIDNKALISIIGSEMDWVEDKLSARFTFKNPNITEQCGCGESFSIS